MIKKLLVVLVFMQSLFAIDATMEIIKKATNLPIVAITVSNQSIDQNISAKMKKMIIQDLAVSGHFNVSDVQFSASHMQLPDFTTLKEANVDLFLIINGYEELGKLNLNYKLFDLNAQSMVLNKQISTNKRNRYPFLAHKASIGINQYFDAPSIDWMDKFVIFSRYTAAKKSEIVIADYTLTYQKVVIKGGLNLFPKWATAAQKSFYYTTYNKFLPTVLNYNIYTGKKKYITKSDGMIVCSDVSQDGTKLLLTMAPNAQPDIYEFNTKTKKAKRLTRYSGIDVGAQYVENDTKFVFVSDRLGKPNIFAKGVGSRAIERLVYHGKNNNSATTYKDYIVYTSKEGAGIFNLNLISTQSDFLRPLTMTGKNQFPKFSADGETIIFTKEVNGRSSLGIIRLNYNKSFLFPLKSGKLQSIDW
ncbi:MAG: Tol-Pal system protein TolB [Campylobacterota bacterium]|nr:Tol-Pal system protein TolB [Campylobacterota bacterium]